MPLVFSYLVLVTIDSHTHAFLYVGGRNLLGQIHDELGKLFHIDNVLRVFRVGIDNLCASSNLKRLLRLQSLLIGSEIPKSRRPKTSVRFLQFELK